MKKMAIWMFAAAAVVTAHEAPRGTPITITGTVVDTGCYFSHEEKPGTHAACAAMCAKNGIPLAIADESGKLYLPIASDHQNANARLMPFIEKKVIVTGTAVAKGGMNGIVIATVKTAR